MQLSDATVPILPDRGPVAGRMINDAADARRRAAPHAPAIRALSGPTPADRRVPAASIAALHAAGLFAVATPKRFGGSGLGMDAALEATIEIAAACGSTGWVYGVLAGHTWLVANFPEAAQAEVFSEPNALIAALIRLGGSSPERVPGGYRWRGGRGKFCSGIDHAQWVFVGGVVTEPDGTSTQRYFLIPRADVEIEDDWYTAGLRGTGSKSITVRDAFIPEHRSVTMAAMLDGTSPGGALNGSYYQLPFQLVWPMSLPGTAMGTARAALDVYTEIVRSKLGALSDEGIAEQSPSFIRLAEASARIDSAELLLLTNARKLNALRSVDDVTPSMRAQYRRDNAFAVQECRRATNALFEASGGSGVYETSPLERIWRDNNVSSAHIGFAWDAAATAFGRDALGLAGAKTERIGR
jgi:alkylation response protein AidB-like acyl-CoA dehydrogenase